MDDTQNSNDSFSIVMVTLLKGVTYADDNPRLWQQLLTLQTRVRDYVREIGLELVIFEDEGFAWLKSGDTIEDSTIPRLISKRQLSYPVSLLLALLRRRLAEHDATSSESRLILSKDDLVQMIRTFLPGGSNETRIVNQIDSYINKIADMGFIRFLRTGKNQIEVRRILKAFVDAQWLNEFDTRLAQYLAHSSNGIAEEETTND